MKKLFILISVFGGQYSWAGPMYTRFDTDVACLGTDGVPLYGQIAADCCKDGSLKDEAACAVGFHSTITDSLGGASGAIQLAHQALKTAEELSGGSANLTDNSSDKGSNGAGSGADTQAIGSKAGDYPSSTGGAAGGAGYLASVGKGSGGSGSGSGAGAGSGDGGGMGLGSAGSTGVKGKKSGSEDALTDKYNIGGYTHGEAAAGGKAGDPTKVSLDGFGEQNIGGNSNGAGGAGSGLANGDEDGSGSPNDPSDYFSRLNKSDNLFKIVSKRYVQKKSLWSPQSAVTSGIVPVIKR